LCVTLGLVQFNHVSDRDGPPFDQVFYLNDMVAHLCQKLDQMGQTDCYTELVVF
jgi:hypothetical protein